VVAGVVILIVLIGIVTYIAWNVINRTVQEQFQTAELQLVTSMSQQMQASLNNLEGDINSLAGQEEIRATSNLQRNDAIELLASQAEEYPEGAIRSITRFDFRGTPRYAWPEDLNRQIQEAYDPQSYPYQVPEELVAMTERAQRATSEIVVELHRVPFRDGGITLLLIAPVNAVNQRTEFLAYELDLAPIFANLFSFVDLGETGQLWVIDGRRGNVQYEARPTPTIETIQRKYSFLFLSSIKPTIENYDSEGGIRQAAIANSRALNETFIIFLSRNASEAQQGVTENVVSIFAFSVVSMLVVVGLGSVFARQIAQSNEARRVEAQRRQTARTLLEVSRALNSSLELSIVLERILGELQRLVPHDSASVFLMEEDELRVAASRGVTGENIETTGKQVYRLDEVRAAQSVVHSDRPIVINDTWQDERWARSGEDDVRSWMGLPLRVRDRAVGVLNINSREANRFRPDDIEVAEAFADQASVALQNARLHEIELRQYEQELTIARGIQTSLLPSESPDIPQIEFANHALPARQVSGDYFQYLPMPNGRIGIAIGDVQGKGIPAALMMAVITTAMRDEVLRHQDAAKLLQALNTRLLDRMKRNHMNSGLLIAMFDPYTREITLANGGMVQPYFRKKGSEKFEFVQVSGYPIGISENMQYTPKTIQFESGSVLILFSDGVVEARSSSGEFFGFDRIEKLLANLPETMTAQEIMERIVQAVQTHLGEELPQDDTTIIVLRGLEYAVETPPSNNGQKPAVAPNRQLIIDDMSVPMRISPPADGSQWINIELFLPSQLGFEKVPRSTIGALAREVGFSEDRVEDLKTAVAEACMNAIEHGNGSDPTLSVSVLISVSPTRLEIRISDVGKQKIPIPFPEPGKGDMRGWGLYFIQHLVDRFEVRQLPDGGNRVLMVVYKEPEKVVPDAQLSDNTTTPSPQAELTETKAAVES
jgi:serine phosphatase RsbU (regulator of sigma subunit)/anti-sigma regulatory factor (Ser/Thr protein kinase)